MSALPLQLEIQGSSNFTFLIPPQRFEPRREVRWKRAANPQVVEEFLDTWDFSGALLVSSNGTAATLWTEWLAFLARLETRGSQPTYARIMRDPAGSNAAVWTLGPSSGYEQLRFESIRAGSAPIEAVAAATWQVVIPVDLTISAVLKKPDATTGIVGWDQVVRISYDDAGLQIIEWETTVTTLEGTDARTKARTYGLIPIATYGDSYSFLTNGDDGVEVSVSDADEQNSRVPTVAVGLCRIKQWAVSVGTSGPGVSPNSVEVEIVTETDFKKGAEIITRTATAIGPAAQDFCEAQIPGGLPIEKQRTTNRTATRFYEIEWIQKRKLTQEQVSRGTIRVQITGGRQDPQFELACGAFGPVRFTTPTQPYTVTVLFEATSPVPATAAEMPLPKLLEPSTGLYFVPTESFEDAEPYEIEIGQGEEQTFSYKREAKAVYRSGVKPPADLVDRLVAGTVPSWSL